MNNGISNVFIYPSAVSTNLVIICGEIIDTLIITTKPIINNNPLKKCL